MRFQSLDGWRGIAALLVSLYHLEFSNHLSGWKFLMNSYLFVDFFFVLSGFVITHAYQNKLNNKQEVITFLFRRIARLLPLHLFVLLLFIGVEFLKLLLVNIGSWNYDTIPFTEEYSVTSLVSNLFLLHSLGIHDTLTWNFPSWSISVEFYTYLVFAVVIGFTHRFKHFLNIQFFLLITISLWILFVNTKNLNYATYELGIFRCIAGFFLGSISYQLFLINKNRIIPYATILEVSLIIGVYFFIVYLGDNKLSTFAPLLFCLTVLIFSFEQGKVSNLLKIKVIQNLGKWSYSIYMIHALLILIISRSINVLERLSDKKITIEYVTSDKTRELIYIINPYFMDILTVLFLLVLVLISSLTYKYIEIKGNTLFQKLLPQSTKHTRQNLNKKQASTIRHSLSE